MTSMKIGSSVRAQPTQVNTPVERAAPRVETQATPVRASVDEFTTSEPLRGAGTTADSFAAAASRAAERAALPESLEPFRSALESIANQIAPEWENDEARVGQFLHDAVKSLGLIGKDMKDAVEFAKSFKMVYNLGADRTTA